MNALQHGTAPSPTGVPEQYSLVRSIILHLAPGAVFTAFIVSAAPALEAVGIDPIFALFGGIGLVLVPLELGYLALHARTTTGSWSPLSAVDYRERPRQRRLAVMTAGLVLWFMLWLVVSVALLDEWLADNLFSWLPDAVLQFAVVEEDDDGIHGIELIALILVAVLCNGIAGPVAEELYFRGHLLPRLERYGRGAPIINTVLFATYHFFSPWRYPAIVVGFLPITWRAWRERSLFVSLAAHMTINLVTVMFLVAAALAA